jgi:hypothetical protein
MGSNNFFSKLASYDPLAHALHLPGANKYMQSQATAAAGTSGGGPYAGVAPTLAASAGGYAPGGPGSNPDWKPFVMPTVGTGWQRFSQTFNNDPLAKAVGAPGATNNGNPGLSGGGGPPSVSGDPQAGQGFVQVSQKFAPRAVGAGYGYGGY